MKTIIVPVDGASNIKLEVFDFETLESIYSLTNETPVTDIDGFSYNRTLEECRWFDRVIKDMPDECRYAEVIAPVARGCSGGLVGDDNTLIEADGLGVTLAYTHRFPTWVEEQFANIAGSPDEFYLETGSIRDFPGSLTLIKRFLFEETERPELLKKAKYFGTYGALISGHFMGGDYLGAIEAAGGEHSYWMCHSGARNIRESPGSLSSAAKKIKSFSRLVPVTDTPVYRFIGMMPEKMCSSLSLLSIPGVIPGGHDTCLSHLPVMSNFYQAFGVKTGKPFIHLDAGSWTMAAQIGGEPEIPPDGYKRDIIVQGTVDGFPIVTARYGGGNDFKHLRKLVESRGLDFSAEFDIAKLEKVVSTLDCFVLPNINPRNAGTGPFPEVKGRIINENKFFSSGNFAFIAANLCTAITSAVQIEAIAQDKDYPVVITAAGSKDPYFGVLIATLTGRRVYSVIDTTGRPVSETTSLGAAIAGKAAVLGIHPYELDTGFLGISFRKIKALTGKPAELIEKYRIKLMEQIISAIK